MENRINIRSEIGRLRDVIVHTPGAEVENMTPENAERALYSDILNLSVAGEEYAQFIGVLRKLSNVHEVMDLLTETLRVDEARNYLIDRAGKSDPSLEDRLLALDEEELARQLIEGVEMRRDTLTRYLSKDRYELRPLHNFFFTRDSAMAINQAVVPGNMASRVRQRESTIMSAIFRFHPEFGVPVIDTDMKTDFCEECNIEGGDILVAGEDLLLIGNGNRTTTQGIDLIIENAARLTKGKLNMIVQELPHSPESFIHLDMIFTFLDRDKFMVYEPVIYHMTRYHTVLIKIENGKVRSIRNVRNIPDALKDLGYDMEPVFCGGTKDEWVQEREQWHSGANYFAIAPGIVLGYSRNVHTIEELSRHGFEILSANDVIEGKVDPFSYERCMIGIEGSELSRGGGGARCMTMPVSRDDLTW